MPRRAALQPPRQTGDRLIRPRLRVAAGQLFDRLESGTRRYRQPRVVQAFELARLDFLQVGLEFPADMHRQALALLGQLVNQGGVVCFNELIEQCLLGPVSLIFGVTNGILAIRQHADRAATARLFRSFSSSRMKFSSFRQLLDSVELDVAKKIMAAELVSASASAWRHTEPT